LEQIKLRVHDLEGKLNKKKEKLEIVHDQQLRALEDINEKVDIKFSAHHAFLE
jgi:hypothetical protein